MKILQNGLKITSRSVNYMAFCSLRNFSKISVPGLALDIDGVLRKGNSAIPNAAQTIKLLKTPLENLSPKFKGIKSGIPFVLMTNGGGYLENVKARELNEILGIINENEKVRPDDMVLCHTPIREIAKDYKDEYVVVAGLGDVLSIALDYGFNKAITLDEYSALFPYLSRLSLMGKKREHVEMLAERARKRLGFSQNLFTPPQVKALFMLSDPTMWEENLQITCDLLISKNGIPGTIRDKNEPQFVKFYMTNPDIVYADAFVLPRLAQGCYLICLDEIFKKQYGIGVDVIAYGKPMTRTFKYAERVLCEKYGKKCNIKDFYMIGDNPEGDIKGANINNWKSCLVKTGLFKGPGNDKHNPATFVKEDAFESVKHILKIEGVLI